MMDEFDEIGDAIKAVQFPRKRTKAEQWQMLRQLLGDEDGRTRLTDAIERSMLRRKRVNIQKLVTLVGDVLGEEYGVWAEEVLWEASLRTTIEVVDGKDDWNA